MSKQMKPIDLRKLAKNFSEEKSKEDLHWQRNDAKFRAVHQRCSTYDEFRNIVAAAHLRPLDRNETLTLERQSLAWNQPAGQNSSPSSSPQIILPSESSLLPQINTFSTPKNVIEFIQQWRRIPNDMKLDYLHQLKNLEHIFQTDIPTDLLHDLSLLYQENSLSNDAELIVNILTNLIRSKRFEIIKSFLTKKDQSELDLLFSRLCTFANLRFSVFLLRKIYL
ncbi:unnamed protein product [Adineta steineri]|uniref:Coiled-coil domain-containing protein n=1 Tax=Adineta steineri TaxID=433720 RepID=A0A814X6P7_9BILA|nr:unnamed protein product [Adineta steineri]CAF3732180.1 unnamed protein product [Adineta steineri]